MKEAKKIFFLNCRLRLGSIRMLKCCEGKTSRHTNRETETDPPVECLVNPNQLLFLPGLRFYTEKKDGIGKVWGQGRGTGHDIAT